MRKSWLVIAIVILLYAGTPTIISRSNAYPSAELDAVSMADCQQQAFASVAAIDHNESLNQAISSTAYQNQLISGEESIYSSTFLLESYTSACAITVNSVNLVFAVSNTSGFVGNLVVTELPSSLSTVGAYIQTDMGRNYCCLISKYSMNWAGYEVGLPSGGVVSFSETTFTQITPSYPTGGCGSYGNTCVVSQWTGLEDTAQAKDNVLAQTGSWAECTNSGCTPQYQAWYEMLPANEINCDSSHGGSVTIHGGDSISTAVTDENYYTKGANNEFAFYVTDANTHTSCVTSYISYTLTPLLGVDITENSDFCSGSNCMALPAFSSTTFTSSEIGWYYNNLGFIGGELTAGASGVEDTMRNGVESGGRCTNIVTNMAPGTLNLGTFSVTYDTSTNTPPYRSNDCQS